MARTTCFVKVSGDAFRNLAFLAWVADLSQGRYVVVCVGGGTQINEELERQGMPFKPHGPLGRELETFAHRQLARNILELNAVECEDVLAAEGIHVHVTIPVLEVGGVLCHVNGDQMVRTVYLSLIHI